MTLELLLTLTGIVVNLVLVFGAFITLRVAIEHRLTKLETQIKSEWRRPGYDRRGDEHDDC